MVRREVDGADGTVHLAVLYKAFWRPKCGTVANPSRLTVFVAEEASVTCERCRKKFLA